MKKFEAIILTAIVLIFSFEISEAKSKYSSSSSRGSRGSSKSSSYSSKSSKKSYSSSSKKSSSSDSKLFHKTSSKSSATARNTYKVETNDFKKKTEDKLSKESYSTNNTYKKLVNDRSYGYGGLSYYQRRNDYYSGLRYTAPSYYKQSYSRFGMWDALFLWMMLDNISDRKYSRFYYNHYNDPDIIKWRNEANRMSADNAELRAKLNKMEREVENLKREGEPTDSSYVPPGVNPDIMLAQELTSKKSIKNSGSPLGGILILIIIMVCIIILFNIFGKKKNKVNGMGNIENNNRQKDDFNPVDIKNVNIPLNLRMGSYVKLNEFFTYDFGENLKFSIQEGEFQVESIGVYEILGIKYSNVYFKPLAEENLDFEYYFNITYSDDYKTISAGRLYAIDGRVYPEDEDEWKEWEGDEHNQGIIGDNEFIIDDKYVYKKILGGNKPIEYKERIFQNSQDNKNYRVIKNYFMLYAREIEEEEFFDKEYVKTTIKEVSKDEAYIQIDIGVDADERDFE